MKSEAKLTKAGLQTPTVVRGHVLRTAVDNCVDLLRRFLDGHSTPEKIEYPFVERIVLIAGDHVPRSGNIKHFDTGDTLF